MEKDNRGRIVMAGQPDNKGQDSQGRTAKIGHQILTNCRRIISCNRSLTNQIPVVSGDFALKKS
jgi:hypothetical protein